MPCGNWRFRPPFWRKTSKRLELWQRLLALNPNPKLAAIAYVNMGTIYNRLGKFEDALDAGKKAVEC